MNLTGEVKPNLLNRIENESGGITEVEYASSAVLYHAAERASQAWEATAPFAVHVVSRITRTDTITGLKEVTTYGYRDAYYDREKQQFRGFREVTVCQIGDATAGQEVRGAIDVHHFHQQPVEDLDANEKAIARALAGREYLVENLDEDGGTRLTWERTDWKVVPVYCWQSGAVASAELDQDGVHVLFPYAFGRLEGTEEGTADVRLKYEEEHRSRLEAVGGAACEIAASHGQVLEHRLYGEVAPRLPGDTSSQRVTTFRRNGTDVDIVDAPDDTRLITYSSPRNEAANLLKQATAITEDAAGHIVAESHYFYDGADYEGLPAGDITLGNLARQTDLALRQDQIAATYGSLTAQPDWASLGYRQQALTDGSGDGLYVDSRRLRYGHFGTITGTRSPLGEEITLTLDGYKTNPIKVTNALGHSTDYCYDYRVGQPQTRIDENGQTWQYAYDSLGRMILEVEPGNVGPRPTRRYEYRDQERPLLMVTYAQQSVIGETEFSTFRYFDGFLRQLQVRSPWDGTPPMEAKLTPAYLSALASGNRPTCHRVQTWTYNCAAKRPEPLSPTWITVAHIIPFRAPSLQQDTHEDTHMTACYGKR